MRKALLIVTLMIFISGCAMGTSRVNLLKHDEQKAIDTANHFLLNLVKGNYETAYNKQTGKRLKQSTSLKDFNSAMKQVDGAFGKMTKASFDYFQPVPGQRAIQLFYTVNHEREGKVRYIFYLEGDAKAGYKISGFRVGKKGEEPQPYVISNACMGDDICAEITANGINTKEKR